MLAAWDVTVIAPPRGGAAAAFAGSVARRVPVKAGLCAAYSAVSCFVRDARGRDDWVSDAAGGAAAGAVVFAMKGASAATFLGGMLVFAAGAASPAIMARMSPTVEETARRRAAPHAGLTGAAYAKAPLAAEGVARRLL